MLAGECPALLGALDALADDELASRRYESLDCAVDCACAVVDCACSALRVGVLYLSGTYGGC